MQLRKKIPGIAKTTTKNILSIIYFRFIDKRKRFIIPGVDILCLVVSVCLTGRYQTFRYTEYLTLTSGVLGIVPKALKFLGIVPKSLPNTCNIVAVCFELL